MADLIRVFETEAEAEAEIARMRGGWPGARAVELYLSADGIDDFRDWWVVEVPRGTGDPLYVRESGAVS